jgi:hypothetical protein
MDDPMLFAYQRVNFLPKDIVFTTKERDSRHFLFLALVFPLVEAQVELAVVEALRFLNLIVDLSF